tara:strand:+ start:36580 stop:36921 length:342 start_codon:yes stop_codon:yes gene_type:complete
MRLLIFLLVLITAVAVYTDAGAGEWQEKPIVCANESEIKAGLASRGEIKLFESIQITPVRDTTGLSEIPVHLPLSIYVSPKTNSYTIIEYHPGYDTYCIISYGTDWSIKGKNT